MRSANNGFHEGLFKNNKFKLKKKLLCAFVCLSFGLKKPRDFTVSEGHRYPLVSIIVVQVGVVKIYVAAIEALRKKGIQDETSFYHQNWWKN
jgi:hypothetical protein